MQDPAQELTLKPASYEDVSREMSYWPYCETCKTPFRFDREEPFAYCKCGTTEWGYPRPAEYVEEPGIQGMVNDWAVACFGEDTIKPENRDVRRARFFEESVELVQACEYPREKAHEMVDFVYDRPVGEPGQEVAGVQMSLSTLATVLQVNTTKETVNELARVWMKMDIIRERQKTKLV